MVVGETGVEGGVSEEAREAKIKGRKRMMRLRSLDIGGGGGVGRGRNLSLKPMGS